MRPPPRLLVLLVILALAAGLVFFSPPPGPPSAGRIVDAGPSTRAEERTAVGNATSGRQDAAASTHLLALRDRAPVEELSTVAFGAHDWTPPPPPPPPEPPPPPPQAPPLPFAYLGKQQENGEWIVFLANQERTYAIKAASIIESAYRVEKISPPTLTLIYLPLQQSQTLTIGSPE